MPLTQSTDLNITPAYREASQTARRKAPWWLAYAIQVSGLFVLAALITWMGRAAWNESRQRAAVQLQSALDTQSAAIDRWYRTQQKALARLSEIAREKRGTQEELSKEFAAQGFFGFVIVNRDGQVLAASSESISSIQEWDRLRPLIQQSLAGGFAATPPPTELPSFRIGVIDQKAPLGAIAFSAPIRMKGKNASGSDLALPDAAIAAWVRTSDEFDALMKIAKFGETGQIYVANFKWDMIPEKSGVNVDGVRQCLGRGGGRMVVAAKRMEQVDAMLVSEMSVAEAYAPFNALWRPIMAILAAIAVWLFAIVFQIAKRLWLRRSKSLSLTEGKRIGQYVVEEKLGEGGMGVVYRAKHLLMRRPAAIKLLDMNRSDSTSLARFEREVRMTALLNHPNTVLIYDYGLTAEGGFYYAMEYIDGVSLDKLIEDGPLSEGRTIHLLAQLCGSLGEAHQVGLIHRDIKPANVLVTERGGLCDFVKLLDFGLVKAVKSKAVGITTDGSAVGTPLFMSPEAIESPEDVDFRSDLYSVGAIGYYLLTGKYVFTGKSSAEVCVKHIQERPKPLSTRGPNQISPDLEHLILQCLEKDRDNRPPTAFDLQQSLLACREAFTWTEDEAVSWWSERKEIDRSQEFAEAAC